MNLIYCYTFNPQFDFLDAGSYTFEGIVLLHDHILYFELIILTVVIWLLIAILINNSSFVVKDLYHGSIIEIIWTLIPGIILLLIALPSFSLLYLMDDYYDTVLSIKVIGNQWYWSYNYNNLNNEIIEFDSYMTQELNPGIFRLLDTDEFLILPSNTPLRFLVTSTDVIHSWGIPSLGIKVDACPGRINQIANEIYRPGLYFGQCYELCGVGHAFMPITLKVI